MLESVLWVAVYRLIAGFTKKLECLETNYLVMKWHCLMILKEVYVNEDRYIFL